MWETVFVIPAFDGGGWFPIACFAVFSIEGIRRIVFEKKDDNNHSLPNEVLVIALIVTFLISIPCIKDLKNRQLLHEKAESGLADTIIEGPAEVEHGGRCDIITIKGEEYLAWVEFSSQLIPVDAESYKLFLVSDSDGDGYDLY